MAASPRPRLTDPVVPTLRESLPTDELTTRPRSFITISYLPPEE
ncbi:uncharacterized protein HHUB_2702 [Halobacterium hubeiense]|uniref:Uncharacterized protein n=1 Tax=Halobacterium hubeiense TaxID=1407499 RepID=A0A0U5HUY2_9EURY|nr:uncharacterized protein HHUB_2702 [Halobacterium hubeiense]